MAKKRVLICPLDWGLGHATRDVIIIQQLIDAGFDVIIGADKAPLYFLRQSFPGIPFIVIPSVKIQYPEKAWQMPFKMLILSPKIAWGIWSEHQFLKNLLKSDQIDILISDNRYGLWNKSVYCIFITHQLQIMAPVYLKWMEFLLLFLNKWFIKQFNACWIPDSNDESNLSGKLSHLKKMPKNVSFTGSLSRFPVSSPGHRLPESVNKAFDLLIILSGPEPQRSMLEKTILLQATDAKMKILLVQGRPDRPIFAQSGDITIVNHLITEHLEKLILETPFIIARSGYTSIMDLVSLKKTAILIPTPGQTEQEYLAKYMTKKKWFIGKLQDSFSLTDAINELKCFNPEPFPNIKSDLQETLSKLL